MCQEALQGSFICQVNSDTQKTLHNATHYSFGEYGKAIQCINS